MQRKLMTAICLCLTLAFLLSLQAWAVTGLAMVHGKGSKDLANQQTAIEYWGSDMIKAATNNYAYPYVIAHYDGTQYMWQAAGQVAAQLHDFITKNNITDLVVVTHSFGGIIMRWIFSNPDYDSRYAKIIQVTRWVNTIASPAKGSEAADMADELSGSWLTGWIVDIVGQNTDATRNCTTSKMAEYNNTKLFGTPGRPSLPKTFRWVSGYGLWNDMAHSEDYGLAMLSGAAGMPGEDDGAVSEYSAQAVGQKWFRTEANHHHNRRNDFDKIGDAIANDVARVAVPSIDETLQTGGTIEPVTSRDSYRAVSTRYVEFVSLPADQPECNIPIYLEQADRAYVAVWPLHQTTRGDTFQISLDTQGSRSMRVAENKEFEGDAAEMGVPAGGQCLVVDKSERGHYPLHLIAGRSQQKRVYAVVVNAHSELKLHFHLSSLHGFSGMPLDMFAELKDGNTAITGATVTVEVAKEGGKQFDKITLFDNGQNGDAVANDGIYTAHRTVGRDIAKETGCWLLRAFASGTSGQPFQRSASLYFHHYTTTAKIHAPEHAQWIENDGQRKLVVSVPVTCEQPGHYRLMGVLSSSAHKPLAWAMTSKQISEAGQLTYKLVFAGEHIGDIQGPFHLRLDLLSLDTLDLAAEPVEALVNDKK